jgi:ArsR family transcriptional regulator
MTKEVSAVDPSQVFHALGHPVRLSIFEMLRSGCITTCCGEIMDTGDAACVSDLVQRFPKAQSTISHHLTILEKAGLVRSEKAGQYTVFRVNSEVLESLKKYLQQL